MQSDHQPLVSFVVLCYRTEQYAGDCIRSILALDTDATIEIIAWDDYSPDGTYEVLRSFTDERLKVFRSERNLGHALALERALRETRGAYVARTDSDDRYRQDFLRRTLPIFDEHPEVGMVYGDASMIGPAGEQYAPRCDQHHGGRNFKGCELVELLELNFICNPTNIARREHLMKHLPVPPHLAFSDWYFSVCMSRETEFYYLDAVLADYRIHSSNLHSRTVLGGGEERSVLWMLDQVFSSAERDPELQQRKTAARGRIYGRQYLTLADKYFGASMNADARRCYRLAIANRPGYALRPDVVRHFLATIMGRGLYDRAKVALRPFRPSA